MDWYRVDRPEWYVGEGWALTPEAAGVSERDGTGLTQAPITAWASRSALRGVLMIGGRNFEPTARAALRPPRPVAWRRLPYSSPGLEHVAQLPS